MCEMFYYSVDIVLSPWFADWSGWLIFTSSAAAQSSAEQILEELQEGAIFEAHNWLDEQLEEKERKDLSFLCQAAQVTIRQSASRVEYVRALSEALRPSVEKFFHALRAALHVRGEDWLRKKLNKKGAN
eukprot:s693_g10.t1